MSDFKPLGAIIAGGQSKRMNGVNKLTLQLNGETLLNRSVRKLKTQIQTIVVNIAVEHADLLADSDIPIVPDFFSGFQGPLAGLSAVMNWAEHTLQDQPTHLVSVAADTPFFPHDLVKSFDQAGSTHRNDILIAYCDGLPQPIFGCWPMHLRSNLELFLNDRTSRKVMTFVRQNPWRKVAFNTNTPPAFFNINTIEDMQSTIEMQKNDLERGPVK